MAQHLSGSNSINGTFTDDVDVAIVIPTYNEADNLPTIAGQLFNLKVPNLGIIVVDDASPDGTGAIADSLVDAHAGRFIVVHRAGKQGLGTAYVNGFQVALDTGVNKIVQMDCDLSHPTKEVPAMLDGLDDADVVAGSRYCSGGDVDPNWSKSRVLLSRWANYGIRMILGLRVRDATSGFKAYRRSALEAIELHRLRLSGFGFQAEVAYRVQQSNLVTIEHPYIFMERTAGKSKMSLGIAIEALWRLTLLRLGLG